jgi:hypothetical protein
VTATVGLSDGGGGAELAGRRRQRRRKGHAAAPTPEAVRAAGENLIAGMRNGSVDRSGKVYKPSTVRGYEASLENYIYDDLGARKLSSVTYPELQDLVDRLAADGLDGSTIRNAVMPLRVLYRRARYAIPVNPTTGWRSSPEATSRNVSCLPTWPRRWSRRSSSKSARPMRARSTPVCARASSPRPGSRTWSCSRRAAGGCSTSVRAGTSVRAPRPEERGGCPCRRGLRTALQILDEHLLRLKWTAGLTFGRTASQPFSYSGVRARTTRATPGRYRRQLDAQYLEDAKTLAPRDHRRIASR